MLFDPLRGTCRHIKFDGDTEWAGQDPYIHTYIWGERETETPRGRERERETERKRKKKRKIER